MIDRVSAHLGDGSVQQLNVHDYYDLGKKIDALEKEIAKTKGQDVLTSSLSWPLFFLRWKLSSMLQEPCALLPASQRAATAVITSISGLIPGSTDDIFAIGKEHVIHSYQLTSLGITFTNFETVLKNDMPEMSTFAVAQIGIFRTDDLIKCAYRQIAEPLLPFLQDKAKADILEAGKCLAFRVSTACAFHSCRAIETGIDQYFEALSGHPYKVSPNGGNNNWGAKNEALVKANADEKVTEFLTHIRKQYRNPVTHPEVVVEEHEAAALFSASLSAISMMLGATKAKLEQNQPLIPGLELSDEIIPEIVRTRRLPAASEESPVGLETGDAGAD